MARLAEVLGFGGFLAGHGDMETLTAVSSRALALQLNLAAELWSGSSAIQCGTANVVPFRQTSSKFGFSGSNAR